MGTSELVEALVVQPVDVQLHGRTQLTVMEVSATMPGIMSYVAHLHREVVAQTIPEGHQVQDRADQAGGEWRANAF